MLENIITLDNGLKICIDDCKTTEVISINVLVKTGSRNEQSKENGISHFLEHMAFKGTKKRTAKQIAEAFENVGGYTNAYTSREHTLYMAKLLKEDFQIGIDILSDILLNSEFETSELEKERKVIIQEIDMDNDTPDDLIFDNYYKTAFTNQPFGDYILGTKEKVNSYLREDLINYMDREYSSDNIIISVCGNIYDNNFSKILVDTFSKFKKKVNKASPKAIYTGGEFYQDKKIEQLYFIMGFEGLKRTDKKIPCLNLLCSILGGGMSSRLFQEVRENHGLAYHVTSYNSSYSDNGTFTLYASTNPNNVKKLIDILCVELKKMSNKVLEEELQRAKNQYKASLLMEKESSNSKAIRYAYQISHFNRLISYREMLDNINSVTTKDIEDLMKNILSSSKMTTTAIGNLQYIESCVNIKNKLLQ